MSHMSRSAEHCPSCRRNLLLISCVLQDDVMGRELVTVREFEPSEAGHDTESPSWHRDERKSCCSIM